MGTQHSGKSNRRFNLSKTGVPCFYIFCVLNPGSIGIDHMQVFKPEDIKSEFPENGMTALSENEGTKYHKFLCNNLDMFKEDNIKSWFESHE